MKLNKKKLFFPQLMKMMNKRGGFLVGHAGWRAGACHAGQPMSKEDTSSYRAMGDG